MSLGPADASRSVEESEKPERNLVADAAFDAVRHDVGVRQVLDLPEAFALASDLEERAAVHREVALLGRQNMFGCCGQLRARIISILREVRVLKNALA